MQQRKINMLNRLLFDSFWRSGGGDRTGGSTGVTFDLECTVESVSVVVVVVEVVSEWLCSGAAGEDSASFFGSDF